MELDSQQTVEPSVGAVPPPQTTTVVAASTPNQPPLLGATRSKHWTGNMTRTIAHYQRMEQIGEGAYGQVYKARCMDTGRSVALKKLIIQHGGYNGMTPSVIREIKILQRLRHPRLVEMIEVVSSKGVEYLDEQDEHRGDQKKKNEISQDNSSKSNSRIIDAREGYKGNLFLVLEYVSHDLMALLDVRYQFTEQQVKCIFKQLLEALEYMHDQKYVHRDLKPANILIDSQHRLKLADFGLARCIEPPILDKLHDRRSSLELTNKVVTVMYRPIEILLGATRYGYSVDMWSAGCILGELVLGKTLMAGKLEMEQLNLIFDLLGTPTPSDGLHDLPLLKTGKVNIDKPRPSRLREKYAKKISLPCLNLLEKLLELDPAKRLTAGRALESRYFKAEPKAPDFPEQLGPLHLGNGDCDVHEFQTKKKRKEVKSIAAAARDEARESGMTDEAAEAIFREVYDEQMLRVQEEGSSALKTREEKEKEEEKKRREEEKRRLETEKQREEERLKSRKNRVDEEERRVNKDKKRQIDDDERSERDLRDRKRRRREIDQTQKSDRRSDREHTNRDVGTSRDKLRGADDDKTDERRSGERGRDRKRSSESRDKERHKSSYDKDREQRRREKERISSQAQGWRPDEGLALDQDILDPQQTPNPPANHENMGKESDNRSRESKRHREHKKSSRRDRERDRYQKSDGDRRERSREHDHERRRRRGDSNGAERGAPLDRRRDDFDPYSDREWHIDRPPDHDRDGNTDHSDRLQDGQPTNHSQNCDEHICPTPGDQRRAHDSHLDLVTLDRGTRYERGSAGSDRGPVDLRIDRMGMVSDLDHRLPDRRKDRSIPPSEYDGRCPSNHRNDRGREDRDNRGMRDHLNDRRPVSSDWDERDHLDRRAVRGPPETWNVGSRGPLDHRGDRGPPQSERDSRGQSWNDLSFDRHSRASENYSRGPVPGGYHGPGGRAPTGEHRRSSPPRNRRR